MLKLAAAVLLIAGAGLGPASGYSPPIDKAGPLTVAIEGAGSIDRVDRPLPVAVTIDNASADAISGRVRLAVIDGWTVAPSDAVEFQAGANASLKVQFTVTPAAGSYSAHYPVHAFAEFTWQGTAYTAHPVLIVQTTSVAAPRAHPDVPWRASEVAPNSGFALWRTPVRRAVVQVFGKEARTTETGWEGVDAQSRASAQFSASIARGTTREAISVHPPWAQGETGTLLIEYPLALPAAPTIRLRFANAVRDETPGQTPGDGVTFRVRALPFDAAEGRQGDVVWERHTAAKTWQDAEADLTRFAGQSIRLQLESHPGPRNNTAFDSAYWAEPVLVAGQPPAQPPFPPIVGMTSRSLGRIDAGGLSYDVRLYPGPRGLLDSAVSFATPTGTLSFQGFHARVLGDALEDWRAPTALLGVREEQAPGRYRVRHSFRNWAGAFDLVGELWIESGALGARLRLENVPAPKPWTAVRIEEAGPRPWSDRALRVYAGPGNVLQDPAAFTLSFDGHRLATSFAGFDFPAMSLVQALDVPPNRLAVDPRIGAYSLRGAHDQTFTFIPARNVWNAVKVWREVNGLTAASGVRKLAGRFVFDLWGGRYADTAAALARAFRYGLTDAVVVWHNWQRWGYDYRLPDIYPPNPQLGTLDEFLDLVRVCRSNGALFAPHDNYIDFYPDAREFSYDHVAFNAAGAPVKAWLNEGRAAQSYRWRPDRLMPFLERNLELIRDNLRPTGYFIDVWSSASPYDYWTEDGEFHGRLETRAIWARAFSWIRDLLGDDAPQISESGHDQLIGSLDGAQANHLRVDKPPAGDYSWAVWNIEAADAERVPWFDAAHHDRFVLHGAGYESRYSSGLDTSLHGIYSDDYITTEVMAGRPAMVSAPFGRDVVRKYWLLRDLMRGLALARIDAVEFDNGDLHRQKVTWENGAEVWVNRGATDWTVAARTLPHYGFYARVPAAAGAVEAAIERRDGVIVEWSRAPAAAYYSARPYVTSRLPLDVRIAALDYLGDRRFRLSLAWNAAGPIPDGYRIFVHFTDDAGNIVFQGDHAGPGPSGQWAGEFATSVVVRIPDSIPAGRAVELRLGLYSPGGGPRPRVGGLDDGTRRIRLGSVQWTGDGIEWTAFAQPPDPSLPRYNVDARPIRWDDATTAGAFRLTSEGETRIVTPLPGGGPFEIRLRLPAAPEFLEALDEAGAVTSRAPARVENGVVVIQRDPAVFAYRLVR